MLVGNHLTKRYGKQFALDDVTVEFDVGVQALLAPNGAGKTTLIRLVTGLAQPTDGQVLFDGMDIHDLGADYRALLGYLPQQFGFYPRFTVRRFLRYLAALKGLPRAGVDDRIDEVLDLVALSEVAERTMRTLSGGMIQRVGIAQALLNDPAVLVLDEPTTGLDPKERVRFRSVISRLAADRIVVFSTHIVGDIEALASHVLLLRQGRLVTQGRPHELTTRLAGRVHQVRGGDIPPDAVMLSTQVDAHGDMHRILLPSPHDGGVQPTLEDVFLSEFPDQT